MESDYNTELGHRIEKVAEVVGGKRELSRRTAIPESQLYRYIRGANTPGVDVIVRLAEAGGVSLEWLASGRGVMAAPPAGDGRLDGEFVLGVVEEIEQWLLDNALEIKDPRKKTALARKLCQVLMEQKRGS